MAEKKSGERRIRFVPGQGSFVFARSSPFHVILKDTGDPRIKRLQLEESPDENGEVLQVSLPAELLKRLKSEAVEHERSAVAQIEAILHDHFTGDTRSVNMENPLDRVFFNVMEAADLTLDQADAGLQRQIIDVVRHCFRVLVDLRRTGNLGKPTAQKKLQQVLDDLGRLRNIADQEIARSRRSPGGGR